MYCRTVKKGDRMKFFIKTKDLTFKNITKRVISSFILLKVIIICLVISNLYYSNRILTISQEIKLSILNKEKFTEENFKDYLYELNIKYPDLVFNQARLETANFTSKVFKENNNLFGMRKSTSRPTTSIEVENGYAYYNNWKESVQDYCMYASKYLSDLSREQYIDYLQRNYAEDSLYKEKLKSIK